MMDFETSVQFDDCDEATIVVVNYNPGYSCPAKLFGRPEDCHPDESEDAEIISVIAEDGTDIYSILTGHQRAQLLSECWAHDEARRLDAELARHGL